MMHAIQPLASAIALMSAVLGTSAATADAGATAAPAGTVVALSPEHAEAAKEAGARRNARSASLDPKPPRDRAVHGEVGVAIGTGGYRAIYGEAGVPLGDGGFVALSVADERYGRARRRR